MLMLPETAKRRLSSIFGHAGTESRMTGNCHVRFGGRERAVLRQRRHPPYPTYDRTLTVASPNPANPAVTTRVLTIMLVEEY